MENFGTWRCLFRSEKKSLNFESFRQRSFNSKRVWLSHGHRLGKPLSLQGIPRENLFESRNARWVSLWACQVGGLLAQGKGGKFPRVFSGFFSFCSPEPFLGSICISTNLCFPPFNPGVDTYLTVSANPLFPSILHFPYLPSWLFPVRIFVNVLFHVGYLKSSRYFWACRAQCLQWTHQ